jgi:pantetheine-phosphate adenylyltransferase
MKLKCIGIYAGSFDPPTNGHVWVIRTAAELFDQLYIGVGTDVGKQYMFTVDERIELVRESFKDALISYKNDCEVTVVPYEKQYLMNFAQEIGANYIVRGIRSEVDYQFERGMLDINTALFNYNIETVFLMPPKEVQSISSSMIKRLIGYDGWESKVAALVPSKVWDFIIKKVK